MALKGKYKIPIHRLGLLKPNIVKHKNGSTYERKGSKTYLEHIAKAIHGFNITKVYTKTDLMTDQTCLVIEYGSDDD